MATRGERSITVILTSEHLRKMVDDHLLAEDELDDRSKMAGVVQKLVDTGLGLPRARGEAAAIKASRSCREVSMGRNESRRDNAARSSRSHIDDLLDEALTETFPASDPIAVYSREEKSTSTQNSDGPLTGGVKVA